MPRGGFELRDDFLKVGCGAIRVDAVQDTPVVSLNVIDQPAVRRRVNASVKNYNGRDP